MKKKKIVMIIDDNAGILFVMKEALELKGYDVRTSQTFTSVGAVAKNSPDIIYLDVSLLGKDGRTISRALKSSARTKNIPIVILTAHVNARELSEEAGADSYLSKPFDLEHLWQKTTAYTS